MSYQMATYERNGYTLEISIVDNSMTDVSVESDSGLWGTWGSVQDGILYTSHDEERRCPKWVTNWVEKTVHAYEERHADKYQ